jgi:hypothetical protein
MALAMPSVTRTGCSFSMDPYRSHMASDQLTAGISNNRREHGGVEYHHDRQPENECESTEDNDVEHLLGIIASDSKEDDREDERKQEKPAADGKRGDGMRGVECVEATRRRLRSGGVYSGTTRRQSLVLFWSVSAWSSSIWESVARSGTSMGSHQTRDPSMSLSPASRPADASE